MLREFRTELDIERFPHRREPVDGRPSDPSDVESYELVAKPLIATGS